MLCLIKKNWRADCVLRGGKTQAGISAKMKKPPAQTYPRKGLLRGEYYYNNKANKKSQGDEFYCRYAVPYEDEQIQKNGDVY